RSILLASALAAFLWYVLPKLLVMIKGKRRITIHEKKWKKDTVYLYQMYGTKSMSSFSPFCIKIEAFLRLHTIPFERRDVLVTKGENGKVPFIELNGEQTADSNIIIAKLAKQFNVQEYENDEDANIDHSIDHSICSMADFRTYNLLVHYKMSCNQKILMRALAAGRVPDVIVDWLAPVVGYLLRSEYHRRINESIGKFTNEQFDELARKDLEVYRGLLGSKRFLFGDRLTTADCTLFGHLAATYYLRQDSLPMHTLASERFEPL
ncbi:hypothetical protein PMAYCL1PPCAC_15098, partial [Pristionchus mayeri]